MITSQHDAEIIKHYVKAMGKETRAIAYHDLPDPVPGPIIVAEFAPPTGEYDWVYATIGVSHRATSEGGKPVGMESEYPIEFLMYANQANTELFHTMLRLAVTPFTSSSSVCAGDTLVGAVGEGVVKESPLTEILVAQLFFEAPEFRLIHHLDGSHTELLWLIPIHVSERLYARNHGSTALLKLFNFHATDTSDFWRSPVI
ncbi:MAG: suppressor of fused domain protein [Chloroflexota bacterium]